MGLAAMRHFGDASRYPPGLLAWNLGHPNQLFHLLAWPLSYVVSPTLGVLSEVLSRDGALSYIQDPAPPLSRDSEIQLLPGVSAGTDCPSEATGCQPVAGS